MAESRMDGSLLSALLRGQLTARLHLLYELQPLDALTIADITGITAVLMDASEASREKSALNSLAHE